jgi:hypothetical protein
MPVAGLGHDAAAAPEPRWEGPGDILALGVQDGRHRLGAVRAALAVDAAGSLAGNMTTDMATLQRLLAHYGVWLGFEGRAQRVRAGKLRWLPALVGPHGTVPGHDRSRVEGWVEYRLDLKRIARGAQRLTADATILLDGRPAATIDGLSIAFRPTPKPADRPARGAPSRIRPRATGTAAKKAAALRPGAPRAG